MSRRRLTTAALAAVSLAGATAGPSLYADYRARGDIARLFPAGSALRMQGIDVAFWSGTMTLRDVDGRLGALHVHADALTLPLKASTPGFVTSAWAQTAMGTGSASASNVTIVSGSTTYSAKSIGLSGTSLSDGDLTALLDPKNADGAAARVRKLNARAISVPDLSIETTTPADTTRVTISQIQLAGVTDGKIGSMTATGLSITDPKSKEPIGVKTGAIMAKDVDLLAALHVVQGTRTDDAEPLKTVAGSLSVANTVFTDKTGANAITIGSLTQKGLRARPLKTDPRTFEESRAGETDATAAARKDRQKAVLDDIAGSYEFDALTLENVALLNPEKSGIVAVALGKLDAQTFRNRTVSTLTFRGFKVDANGAKVSIASADVAGLALPAQTGETTPTADGLSLDTMPTVAKCDIAKVDFDANTPHDDGTVSHVKFTVDHIGTSGDQTVGRLPVQGQFVIDNLAFDLPKTPDEGARELYAMGYRTLHLSAAADSTYDAKQEALTVRKLMLSGIDMGSIDLAIDLSNVSKGVLSSNQAVAKASALAMLLKRIDLHVVNGGLFEKALSWKADQDGKSVAEEKAAAVDLFQDKLPLLLGNGPGIQAIGSAMATFIASPKTLHVSASSKDGLGVSDMGLIGSPDELLSRLDIQADANH